MLTGSIPIPGTAVAHGCCFSCAWPSSNSLLCWETVVCSYPYYPCSAGLENNAVPEDMSFPETRVPGHREMPLTSQTRPSNGPLLPIRLHTAGRASAKGTRPRPDISAFASKRPKRKSPNQAKIPVAAKREPGRCGGCRAVAARANKRLHRHFAPPNNCPAPAEPQQIRKHKRDFIFSLSPNLGDFALHFPTPFKVLGLRNY